MKKPENLEFKLLMKNIKKNRNIIENRNKTRQEFKLKREQYNNRLNEIKKKNESNLKNKKIEFYNRQMSRDLKDLHKRYNILKPALDETDSKNKKAGIKIDSFSNIHKQKVNKMKNNFYKKNENLKFEKDYFLENIQNTYKVNINKNIKNITNNSANKKKFNVTNDKFKENKGNNKYKFYKDDKLDENKINNVCFDGNFFDNNFK